MANNEIRWIGRDALIRKLSQKLQADCRVLSLVGITGIGKSALAARLILEPEVAQCFSALKTISFDPESRNFTIIARCLLGEQAIQREQVQKEPQLLVNEMVATLKSQACLLILDMVEEVLEANSWGGHQFKEPAFAQFFDQVVRSAEMPSRIIITSQDQPPVIAEGRYPKRYHLERLEGLDEAEALELFNVWDIKTPEAIDLKCLQQIARVYEGHPLALRVIAGEIREAPYNGDVQAYWHDYGQEIEAVDRLKDVHDLTSEDKLNLDRYSLNLTDLVKQRVERTFERLLKSSPLACLLLCMGATYRCAVERSAWLFLIGDYPIEDQRLAFQTLQRRFLLEEESTHHKVLYRLHSLIHQVALDHLSQIEAEILPL